jgi:predicted RNase H-like HicB family nuclease
LDFAPATCYNFLIKEILVGKVLSLTAVIEREGDGYVATCQELDIVSQGETVEGARLNLVEAVEGFLVAASPSEIQKRLIMK